MELSAGLETGIGATAVVAMLSMAVWLFFRRDSNVEKSLFLKMCEPYDDRITQCASVPIFFFPSFKRKIVKDAPTNDGEHVDLLIQNMSAGLCAQPKEIPMTSQSASTIEVHDRNKTVQLETCSVIVGGTLGKKVCRNVFRTTIIRGHSCGG